jgi:6-pyruvoyltetrahydropterin/6-carboxytetrahydropterin synthase
MPIVTKIHAVRRLLFCAGHRVVGHEGKCRNLHGHNYEVFVHAQAQALDSVGRVIDFSVLKDRIGKWIDDYWDHQMLLWAKDEIAIDAAIKAMSPVYTLPDNPTAENIAAYLLNKVCPQELAGTGVTVTKVVVWETPNCYVEAEI